MLLRLALAPLVLLTATAHGITPIAPTTDSLIASGKAPTFRMKVRGSGQVWVHVCRSAERRSGGVVCGTEASGRARRIGAVEP